MSRQGVIENFFVRKMTKRNLKEKNQGGVKRMQQYLEFQN
jgi:hypothetical protein